MLNNSLYIEIKSKLLKLYLILFKQLLMNLKLKCIYVLFQNLFCLNHNAYFERYFDITRTIIMSENGTGRYSVYFLLP